MAKLVVLRHSRAVANEQHILMGRKLDSPLSEGGIALAHKKGKALRAQSFKPDKVYTSQLRRAVQTAQILLAEIGSDTEIIQLADLNERDFGQYDGRPYAAVLNAFATFGDNPPTIEPVTAFITRVSRVLARLKRSTGTTLVITHSNPAMVMQAALFHPKKLQRFWDIGDPQYCEGFIYEYEVAAERSLKRLFFPDHHTDE